MNIRTRGQVDHDRNVQIQEAAPLAEKLRPKTVDEVVGQDHLLAIGFSTDLDAPATTENIIFWGPPG